MSVEKWFRVDEVPAPIAIAVKTKIDDEHGVRHVRPLQRIDDGRLWWTIDGAMYVYYTPTHWRFYAQGEVDAPSSAWRWSMVEIDEAAERARWISNVVTNVYTKEEVNLARAALAWKARAESAEAELKSFETQLSDYARRATNDEQVLLARAEAAEAERDSLKRQLAQSVKAKDRLIEQQAAEIAALKAKVDDAETIIRGHCKKLSGVPLERAEYKEEIQTLRDANAALKAEVERPRCNDLLCRCCARRAR